MIELQSRAIKVALMPQGDFNTQMRKGLSRKILKNNFGGGIRFFFLVKQNVSIIFPAPFLLSTGMQQTVLRYHKRFVHGDTVKSVSAKKATLLFIEIATHAVFFMKRD